MITPLEVTVSKFTWLLSRFSLVCVLFPSSLPSFVLTSFAFFASILSLSLAGFGWLSWDD